MKSPFHYRIIDNDNVPVEEFGERKDLVREAEESLRESRERFRTLSETISAAVFVYQENALRYVNPWMETLTGYSREELLRMNFWDLVHPEFRETARLRGLARQRGKAVLPQYELKIITKNGQERWLDFNASLIDYEGRPAALGTAFDITARKEAEAALRASEALYRTLMDSTSDMIIIKDSLGRHLFANRAALRYYGRTAEQVIGRRNAELMTPEAAEICSRSDRAALESADVVIEEHSVGERIYQTAKFPVMIRPGEKGLGAFIRDVTKAKHSEQAVRETEARLRHAEKMEAIGTLAGGIAHDFNNLLMGIQGYAAMMLHTLATDHPHHEKLKTIEKQAQSGATLTRQLLGFARGNQDARKSTNLNKFIDRCVGMFGRTHKEIKIHKRYEEPLRRVEIDRGQMDQVLLNLFINAWQAMPDGGDLHLETRNCLLSEKSVHPYGLKPGGYCRVTILDTGIGMDERTRQRIFEPFFTTKQRDLGTGLGLASAYGIIKNHGGFIEVFSEPGQGSTFHIYLPASKQVVFAETKADERIITGSGVILVVDDEPVNIEVMQGLLDILGYRVFAAGDGQEAVAIYMERRSQIDLVILDMIMPGVGGGKTFDMLREINPDCRIILASGCGMNGEAKGIMERGCNGFVQKPFTVQTLSRTIAAALEK